MSEPKPPPTPPVDDPPRPAVDEAVAPVQPTQPVAAVHPGEPPAAESAGARPAAGRPSVPRRRPGPLTVMGPWAPVAGALLGLVAGIVAVLVLRTAADDFPQRLSLVLLVLGMSMLGATAPLLADEVRMVRRGAREATRRGRPEDAAAAAGLTPARWLLLVSAFVLFLAAYVGR